MKKNNNFVTFFYTVILFLNFIILGIFAADVSHKVARGSTKINRIVYQEFVTEDNLKVTGMEFVKSNLSINLTSDESYDPTKVDKSKIEGSIEFKYTLSDSSELTKTIEAKDLDNIPGIGSVLSTQYYKGIYDTELGKSITLKSKNKLEVNSNTRDFVKPIYEWKEIVPHKNQIQTTIKVIYKNSKQNTTRIANSQYIIK